MKTECLREGWQTSGSAKIVRMAFNLYCNGTLYFSVLSTSAYTRKYLFVPLFANGSDTSFTSTPSCRSKSRRNHSVSLGVAEPDELDVTLVNIMEKVINDEDAELGEGIIHHEEGKGHLS